MNTEQVETDQDIHVTASAAGKVRRLVDEEDNPDLKLRVFVTGGGCSGFQYGFLGSSWRHELLSPVPVQAPGSSGVSSPLSFFTGVTVTGIIHLLKITS